ncbi:MAG: acetyl-CoA carboxylase biotin carboxyl carrier protein [Brevinema sp.]
MSNITEIKKIYDLFSGLNIDFIDIETPEGSFSISFGNENNYSKHQYAPIPNPETKTINTSKSKLPELVKDIVSPAVGIFERSNPRTGEYYIKLRDTIKVGQVIGHILVLGIRHDVVANISGKIIEMLVEDEQPIEYGQPVIRVEISNEEA